MGARARDGALRRRHRPEDFAALTRAARALLKVEGSCTPATIARRHDRSAEGTSSTRCPERLGITGVTDGGKLVGVVADGDLRRLLEKDGPKIMADTAADAMGRDPKTIARDAWATEALRMMEERKITSLFVVTADGRPEGILHLHDLWGIESI